MSAHLGVDALRLSTIRSGVARHLENVLRCWSHDAHPFDQIRAYVPAPLDDERGLGESTRVEVVKPWFHLAVWQQLQLPIHHGRKNVLYCPSYVAPLMAKCPVVLLHHGSYEAWPSDFGWWTRQKAYRLYRASARRADRVITVSESSRRDMARFYGLREDTITVVPNGVDRSVFFPISDPERLSDYRRRTFGEDVPFVLFVGKPNKRHNVDALLAAFAELRATSPEHRLLMIGTALPGVRVTERIERWGLREAVVMHEHREHEEIALAMNAAELLIYPSSYEGFGMPVLEAMACGTPTITSDNTAFPEFASGVALLTPDNEPGTLVDAMRKVIEDASLRRSMRHDGPERAKQYSWERTAREIMKVIEEVA